MIISGNHMEKTFGNYFISRVGVQPEGWNIFSFELQEVHQDYPVAQAPLLPIAHASVLYALTVLACL